MIILTAFNTVKVSPLENQFLEKTFTYAIAVGARQKSDKGQQF